jgi:two-component system OmpR family response regulator
MKLLVVDDDLHIRRLIGIYLRDAGFEVTEAATGEEGLQVAQREAFDIVLIDLILPHYGGFRLCQKLKSAPAPPRVVITTGDDSPQSRNLAKESNADGFLAKPFTRDELLAAVRPSP